ncbi:MAG: hydantoinase/oxoprolinase family protein [Chloroflexota bacterium]
MSGFSGYRIGVDIGGTFTDLVLLAADGSISTRKLPTGVDNHGRVVVDGVASLLEAARLEPAQVQEIVHGTTVATNALLEGKGARTGLVTTLGFRDVLELRRIRSPELYNLHYEKPPPLVPRRFRLEVDERINHLGQVERQLDLADAEQALTRLAEAGVRSLAICFLNAYANAEHEQAVGDLARRLCPDWDISLSSDVLPEIREYERTSTTVINAYLKPVVRRYLQVVRDELDTAAVDAPLLIMQSNGGIMSVPAAQKRPIQIIESGPAAGVIASAVLAERLGLRNVLTFDMGGTTAKASIIEDGQLSQTSEYEVGGGMSLTSRLIKGGGYALRTPVIDIAEVGAGGVSIVWLDPGGALQVGPHSAGAVPGPVCYGKGGTAPTVTDANIVLGYLNPDQLVGGDLKLDIEAARRVMHDCVAQPLGLALDQAAFGVHLVANSHMVRAVRAVSSQRGRDPRGFALFAFGGNGPVHAVELARSLDQERVLVPAAPGLFSAFGLLFAEVEHHYVRTCFRRTTELDLVDLGRLVADLEREAFDTLGAEGYAAHQVALRRQADLRYTGQSFELTVALADVVINRAAVDVLTEAFAHEHLRTYGHRSGADAPVDLINIRITARGVSEQQRVPSDDQLRRLGRQRRGAGACGSRSAYFGSFGRIEVPVVDRASLDAGFQAGPLIVEEYDATTVVPPGCSAALDEWGNIVIQIQVSG